MKQHIKLILAFVVGQLTGIYGLSTLLSAAIDFVTRPQKVFDTLRVGLLFDEDPKQLIEDIKECMHEGIKIHSIEHVGEDVLVKVAAGKGKWAANHLDSFDLTPDEVFLAGYGEITSETIDALKDDWI